MRVEKARKVKKVDRKAVNLEMGKKDKAEAEAPAKYEYPDPEECELAP